LTNQFTSKERDAENGLDYFGARYYSSNMGRFMSPDWAEKPEAVPCSDLADPQSLNLYGYARNNPLSKEDPDEHNVIDWLKKQGCNLGITSQCTPPPQQPQQQQPQQQQQQQNNGQQLVNAQDNARNNPNFQPNAGTTHCSEATCSVGSRQAHQSGP
jgi:RHS repeat-associated protein